MQSTKAIPAKSVTLFQEAIVIILNFVCFERFLVFELIVLFIDMIHPADYVGGDGGAGGEAGSVAGHGG